MPIARATSSRGAINIPGAVASGDIRKNATLAVINDGAHVLLIECSSISNANQFVGFAASNAADGESLLVFTVRGAVIEPIIEGAGSLILNEPVFLSDTLGEVMSGPPVAGTVIFQVGLAISDVQLSLNTDSKFSFR